MNTSQRYAALSLGIALGAATLAAQADSATAHLSKPTKPGVAVADAGWVTARQKHNASGLSLRYQTPDNVKLGQRAQVALVISGVTAADGAQVELKASDPAMTVMMNGNPVNAPIALPAGGMHRLNLDVTNAPEGLHYVTLYMTQNGRTSVTSVPVKVGHGQSSQKAEGQVQTTPSGEKIIVMPAATK